MLADSAGGLLGRQMGNVQLKLVVVVEVEDVFLLSDAAQDGRVGQLGVGRTASAVAYGTPHILAQRTL